MGGMSRNRAGISRIFGRRQPDAGGMMSAKRKRKLWRRKKNQAARVAGKPQVYQTPSILSQRLPRKLR